MTIAKPKTQVLRSLVVQNNYLDHNEFFLKCLNEIKRSLNVQLSLSSFVFSNSVDMMSQNNEALLDP